jgi:hypothetical protein
VGRDVKAAVSHRLWWSCAVVRPVYILRDASVDYDGFFAHKLL